MADAGLRQPAEATRSGPGNPANRSDRLPIPTLSMFRRTFRRLPPGKGRKRQQANCWRFLEIRFAERIR